MLVEISLFKNNTDYPAGALWGTRDSSEAGKRCSPAVRYTLPRLENISPMIERKLYNTYLRINTQHFVVLRIIKRMKMVE